MFDQLWLQVYFLMAKIHFFKFEWSKKESLALFSKDINRSDLDIYPYTAQWKGVSYLNELIPEAVVLS